MLIRICLNETTNCTLIGLVSNVSSAPDKNVSDNWLLRERETYTTSTSQDVYLLETYTNQSWNNYGQNIIYFNDNQDTVGVRKNYWNNTNWSVSDYIRFLLTYNENDIISEKIIQDYNIYSGIWANKDRFIYSDFQYFEMGNKINGLESTVHIYPNPVSTTLIFDFLERAPEERVIQIFNLFGQKEYEGKLLNSQNRIDVSFLSRGMYLLHLSVGNNEIICQKFLKQ